MQRDNLLEGAMGRRDRELRLRLLLLLRRLKRLRLLCLCRAFALLELRSAEAHNEHWQRGLKFSPILYFVSANLTAYLTTIALIAFGVGSRVAFNADNDAIVLDSLDNANVRDAVK